MKRKKKHILGPYGELKWFILWHVISFWFSLFYYEIRKTGWYDSALPLIIKLSPTMWRLICLPKVFPLEATPLSYSFSSIFQIVLYNSSLLDSLSFLSHWFIISFLVFFSCIYFLWVISPTPKASARINMKITLNDIN